MSYEVFARKYRPRVFDDLVGQEAIAQALRYAVANDRTASVYLFAGSHGVGKTSVARILAKALNCPSVKDGAPCGTCETCESIGRAECMDVVEIDAASNSKIDDMRALKQSVGYKPASLKYKVYILDEFHRLSKDAFDALLKTFEESPPLVRFVLATTELHKVPTTILSRAQVFRFQRAGLAALVKRLRTICEAEKLVVEDAALRTIARRARGSIRDSQKLLDQVAALAGASSEGTAAIRAITSADVAFLLGDASEDVVARCVTGIVEGRPGDLLGETHGFIVQGGRADALATDLLEALRGALYLKTAGPASPLLEDVALAPEDLGPMAEALSEEGLLYGLQILQDAQTKMRDAREPRLVLELALVRLARARELRPVGEVLARLERLEKALGPGSGSSAPGAARAAAPTRVPAPTAPAPTAPAATTSLPRDTSPVRSPSGPEAPRSSEAGRGPERPGAGPPRARSGYDYPGAFQSARAHEGHDPRATGAADASREGPRAERPSGVALADPPRLAPALATAPALMTASTTASGSTAAVAERPAFAPAPTVPQPPPAAITAPVTAAPVTSGPPAPDRGALAPYLAAWDKVRATLSGKHVALGRALDRSRPLALHGSVLLLEVRTSDLLWGQLQDQASRAAEIVREVVGGAPIDLKLERVREAVSPVSAPTAAPTRGPGSGSIFDEPVVVSAQRVLGSQQIGGGW